MKEDAEVTLRLLEAYFAGNQILPKEALHFVGEMHERVREVFYNIGESQELVQCMECGKKMATLRKHLRAQHGLTVGQYLEKFSLPKDSPITAAVYSQRRHVAAKKSGLGVK